MNVYHQKFWTGFFMVALASLTLGCSSHYDEFESKESSPKETVSFGIGQGIRSLCNRPDRCEAVAPTDLRVFPGDLLEIRLSLLRYEALNLAEPEAMRQDNIVCVSSKTECVKTAPAYKRKCSKSKYPCVKCRAFPPTCVPWLCSKESCRNVKVGERCVQSKKTCTKTANHWTDHTVFPPPGAPEITQADQPMQFADALLKGINLKFELQREGKPAHELTCPLSHFRTRLNQGMILVLLENREACGDIFELDRTEDPRLSIVNAVELPFQYLEGTRSKAWNGKTVQEASTRTFHPLVEIGGVISLYPARRLTVD